MILIVRIAELVWIFVTMTDLVMQKTEGTKYNAMNAKNILSLKHTSHFITNQAKQIV